MVLHELTDKTIQRKHITERSDQTTLYHSCPKEVPAAKQQAINIGIGIDFFMGAFDPDQCFRFTQYSEEVQGSGARC